LPIQTIFVIVFAMLESRYFYPLLAPPQDEHSMGLEFENLKPYGEEVQLRGGLGVRFEARGISAIRYFPPTMDQVGSRSTNEGLTERLALEGYYQDLVVAGAEVEDPLAGLPTEGHVTLSRQGDLFVARAHVEPVNTIPGRTDGPVHIYAPYRPGINDRPHQVTGIRAGEKHGLVYTADSRMGRWAFKITSPNLPAPGSH
jgi:hypothetical protein